MTAKKRALEGAAVVAHLAAEVIEDRAGEADDAMDGRLAPLVRLIRLQRAVEELLQKVLDAGEMAGRQAHDGEEHISKQNAAKRAEAAFTAAKEAAAPKHPRKSQEDEPA